MPEKAGRSCPKKAKDGVEKMKLLVSACLLGCACRYDGAAKQNRPLVEWLKSHGCTPVPVCPEIYGGLPTPRTPAERQDGRVVNRDGQDVTAPYEKGAAETLALARLTGCEAAVLKARSPSCGCGMVYDGSFTGTLVPGNGVAAELLLKNGLPVFSEETLDRLDQWAQSRPIE